MSTSAARETARPAPPSPPQSWLELFYDLAFVAAIVVLSGTYSKDTSWSGAIWLAVVFSAMWLTWLCTTLLLNRVELRGMYLRTLVVLQMMLVLGMVVTSDYTKEDFTDWTSVMFLGVLVVLALMYRDVLKQKPELRANFGGRAVMCLAAAVLMVPAALIDSWWYLLPWGVGLVLLVMPAPRSDHHLHLDGRHLVHRFGEFTIIMLGEAFVKVGLVATHEPLDELDIVGLPLTFVIVAALWWLYFTDIPGAGYPERRHNLWLYAHFPLHLGVTATAVGLSRILYQADEASDPRTSRFILLPLMLVMAGLAALNWAIGTPLARRRMRIHLVGAAALLTSWALLQFVIESDLESTAVVASVVLVLVAARIRSLGADTPRAAVGATDAG